MSPETIALARMILGNLPVEVRVPHVAPSADGEVGFTWVRGRDRLEAMLHPDKHLVWIKKISGNFAPGDRYPKYPRQKTSACCTPRSAIFMSVPEPCPCEDDPPATAPGPCRGRRVAGSICFRSGATWAETTKENYFIVPAGVPKDDLRQHNGSVFLGTVRETHIDKGEMITRAAAATKTKEWKADPVLGRATATALRSIRDKAQRREVCVNADPTTAENDWLGPCAAHASIVRSTPPLDENDR